MANKDKAGYFFLGVATDYFLFKPARKFKGLWYYVAGVVTGVIWTKGLDAIVLGVKELIRWAVS